MFQFKSSYTVIYSLVVINYVPQSQQNKKENNCSVSILVVSESRNTKKKPFPEFIPFLLLPLYHLLIDQGSRWGYECVCMYIYIVADEIIITCGKYCIGHCPLFEIYFIQINKKFLEFALFSYAGGYLCQFQDAS
jgi:hypothetical protein